MAAQVVPLPQLKLATGPAPMTAEQRYWRAFKNQLLVPSPTGYPVTHISCGHAETFAVTTGTRVQIFSTRTRKLLKTITRFADVARSGDLRRDGRVLVAGSDAGSIQIFDVRSRAILRTWGDAHRKQPVWAARFSPTDPTTVLSAGDDATVRLWDLPAGGEPVATFVGHGDYVRCAGFLPGAGMARMALSGSYDATVRLWDPRIGGSGGGRAVMVFKHAAPVEDVLALPGGTTVLAAAGPNVSVLDLVAAKPLHMLANHQKTVTSLSLASGGRRVVTGGLEGHVKVFETTGWNVVNSVKYSSPILCMQVIPSPSGSTAGGETVENSISSSSNNIDGSEASTDRHLAVGMQSGVLSLRTRLTGREAEREREREREMAALVAGTYDTVEAQKAKRKRILNGARRLADSKNTDAADAADDDDVFVLAAQDRSSKKRRERPWQADLRHGRYGAALEGVLDRSAEGYAPRQALGLLLGLRHRGAVREALERLGGGGGGRGGNGNEPTALVPLLRWLCVHVRDPRYVSVCVEVGLHLHDLYGECADADAELAEGFRALRRSVRAEVGRAEVATETGGMLDSLMIGSV